MDIKQKLQKFPEKQTNHNIEHSISNTGRKQVKVYNHRYHEFVKIDKEIAELIYRMWCMDIETLCTSTSEDSVPRDYIFINFASMKDVDLFLEIIFDGVDKKLPIYKRAISDWSVSDNWQYGIICKDWNDYTDYDDVSEHVKKYNRIDLAHYVSITFPKVDYNFILEQFISANKERDIYDCGDNIIDEDTSNYASTSDSDNESINKDDLVEIIQNNELIRDINNNISNDDKLYFDLQLTSLCSHPKKDLHIFSNHEPLHIDKTIFKLVEYALRHEIRILSACEKYRHCKGDYIRIDFPSSDDLNRFHESVFCNIDNNDDMYIRAITEKKLPDKWLYKHKKYYDSNDGNIKFKSCVLFPERDHLTVLKNLKQNYKDIYNISDLSDDSSQDNDNSAIDSIINFERQYFRNTLILPEKINLKSETLNFMTHQYNKINTFTDFFRLRNIKRGEWIIIPKTPQDSHILWMYHEDYDKYIDKLESKEFIHKDKDSNIIFKLGAMQTYCEKFTINNIDTINAPLKITNNKIFIDVAKTMFTNALKIETSILNDEQCRTKHVISIKITPMNMLCDTDRRCTCDKCISFLINCTTQSHIYKNTYTKTLTERCH